MENLNLNRSLLTDSGNHHHAIPPVILHRIHLIKETEALRGNGLHLPVYQNEQVRERLVQELLSQSA